MRIARVLAGIAVVLLAMLAGGVKAVSFGSPLLALATVVVGLLFVAAVFATYKALYGPGRTTDREGSTGSRPAKARPSGST